MKICYYCLKGIRGGICSAIHKYVKANNKYMKNYDSSKQSTYLMYVDANNLYRYAMTKTLPIGGFKWETDLSIFTEDFIKNHSEESDVGYLLVIDVIYPESLFEEHKYLPFLPNKTKVDKVTKLTCDLCEKILFYQHFCITTSIKSGFDIRKGT